MQFIHNFNIIYNFKNKSPEFKRRKDSTRSTAWVQCSAFNQRQLLNLIKLEHDQRRPAELACTIDIILFSWETFWSDIGSVNSQRL